MALNTFDVDVNNVQGFLDQPTEPAAEVKEIFDQAGNDIKTYMNTELVVNIYDKSEVDSAIAAAEVGQSQKASTAEAEAGVVDDKWMTPLKTVQSINANVDLSTTGKVDQYTDSTSLVVTDHIAYNVQTGKNITLVDGNRCLWKADEDSKEGFIQGSSITLNGTNEFRISQSETGELTDGATNFELICKFNSNNDTIVVQTLISKHDTAYTAGTLPNGWNLVAQYDTLDRVALISRNGNGSSAVQINTANSTIAHNTDYWTKLSFDGVTVRLSVSTDGITYTGEVTSTDANLIAGLAISDNSDTQVGRQWNGSGGFISYFSGTIELITLGGTQIDYFETLSTPTLLVDSTATTDITVKDGGNITAGNYYESIYNGATWLTTEMVQSRGNLVASETLTGSSVTIPNLDINADGGGYVIETFNVKTSSSSNLELYINGDTISSNYNNQLNFGTSNSGAIIVQNLNATEPTMTTTILKLNNDKVGSTTFSTLVGTTVSGNTRAHNYETSIDNVSSVTLQTPVGTFTSGTVKIYKRS